MRRRRVAINCSDCGAVFGAEAVSAVDTAARAPTAMVFSECPECGTEFVNEMSNFHVAMMIKDLEDYDPVAEEEAERLAVAEEVGRLVQGFRIDLDAVIDLSDIQLYWGHQERSGLPFEVIREPRMRGTL